MKAGLGRGLGPQHSKAPPGIRPFKASFGGLVTLFLKLFVFLKWPLRRERGLRRESGREEGGQGEEEKLLEPPSLSLDPLTSFQSAFPALISSCPGTGGGLIPTNQMGKLRLRDWKSLKAPHQKMDSRDSHLPRSREGKRVVFLFSRGEPRRGVFTAKGSIYSGNRPRCTMNAPAKLLIVACTDQGRESPNPDTI